MGEHNLKASEAPRSLPREKINLNCPTNQFLIETDGTRETSHPC